MLCKGLILWMHPANERRHYNLTLSLIGWAHSQNDPCLYWLNDRWCTTISLNFLQIMCNRHPSHTSPWWCILQVNMLRPRQNGRHFANDIFKYFFLNENTSISIDISLKFVPEGRINNIPALVQIMAWPRLGAKPLSEPMMVSLLMHICVTRPQWVKKSLTYVLYLSMLDGIEYCIISNVQ